MCVKIDVKLGENKPDFNDLIIKSHLPRQLRTSLKIVWAQNRISAFNAHYKLFTGKFKSGEVLREN